MRLTFLGLPLSVGVDVEDVCKLIGQRDRSAFISFINPQSWALVRSRPEYLDHLEKLDLVLPDGGSVAVACRKIARQDCPRVSFDMSSLAGPFFETLVREDAGVMFVGGKPGVSEAFAQKIATRYQGLKILGCDSGYAAIDDIVTRVMRLNPRAVVLGMGVPHQEVALLALKAAGYPGIAITCGGFFDQYIEAEQYYPAWVDKMNLRFAYRIYKEPARLWRRYFISYQRFIWKAVGAFAGRLVGIG